MSTDCQHKVHKPNPNPPLFESIWLALFFVLRHEWLQYRNPVNRSY
jgi:hypothetical protein